LVPAGGDDGGRVLPVDDDGGRSVPAGGGGCPAAGDEDRR
jgi:hypothetical protein